LALADRVAVMHQGRVVECAPPADLTERPRHVFTAGFLGARTVLPGRFEGGLFHAAPGLAVAPPAGAPARPTHLVLRAARLRFTPDAAALMQAPGRIAEAAWLGDEIAYEVALDAGPRIRVLRPTTEPALPPGAVVTLAVGADALTFLDDVGDTP
jgi:putative spermidine/putrescine transport system ATP-binding protein